MLDLLPNVNAARVRLLDVPELLRELRTLERWRGGSGRDKVDHPRGSGSHDDRAVAAAGALMAALDGSAWSSEEVQAVLRMGADGGALTPINPEHGDVRAPRVAARRASAG